jgi:hypothetical protein
MGRACLRSDGHHWPAGRAGRADPRGWQTAVLTDQLDAPRSDTGAQHLHSRRDAHAIWLGDCQAEPNRVPNAIGVGEPIGNRDRQRPDDALPIPDGDDLTIAERQPESVGLALSTP